MRITKKSIFFSFLLVFLSLGIVFLPTNVIGNEGTRTKFENTVFFTDSLNYQITQRNQYNGDYFDDFSKHGSQKIGVTNFYNLGYQYYDNDTGKAWFLASAEVDVYFLFWTDYALPQDIFGQSFKSRETNWLDLYWQQDWPYGEVTTTDPNWYHDEFSFGYKSLLPTMNRAPDITDTIDGCVGFRSTFDIDTVFKSPTAYLATDAFTDEDSLFEIPEIALAKAKIVNAEVVHDLTTPYSDYFVGADQNPEFDGWSAVGSIADDVTGDLVLYNDLGLHTDELSDITTTQLQWESLQLAPSTDLNIRSQYGTSVRVTNIPELNVYTQRMPYTYGQVFADVENPNAHIFAGSTTVERTAYRTVGYKIDNNEVVYTIRFIYYVWGTCELAPSIVDEALRNPEFIHGDVFWDISIWGDTSASTLFTESTAARLWSSFWSGAFGQKLKWILIIVVIVAGIGGIVYVRFFTPFGAKLGEKAKQARAIRKGGVIKPLK